MHVRVHGAFISIISFDPEEVHGTETEDLNQKFWSWPIVTLGESLNLSELQFFLQIQPLLPYRVAAGMTCMWQHLVMGKKCTDLKKHSV